MPLELNKETLLRQKERIVHIPKNIFKDLKVFRLKEFEDKRHDDIRREVVQLVDINGNTAHVIVYQSKPPIRPEVNNIFEVFKNYTHIARMHIENKEFDLARGDRLATNYANLLASASIQTGIHDDPGILINGAAIIIVPDNKNPGSIKEKSLQEAVGYLFSQDGPFSNIMIFPDFKNGEFVNNLTNAGSKLLLAENHFKILVQESKKILKNFRGKTGKDLFDYLIAISAYLKKELSIPPKLDGRGLSSDEEDYLLTRSPVYLERLMRSLH